MNVKVEKTENNNEVKLEFTVEAQKFEEAIKKVFKENAKYFLKRKHFFDTSFWPVLKLYNEKLFIPRIIYVTNKKLKYKRKGLI